MLWLKIPVANSFRVKTSFILDSATNVYLTPTLDVSNFKTIDMALIPQEDAVNVSVEVSDDGLTWSTFETLVLPAKYIQVEYNKQLPKNFIRFKADKRTAAYLYLKGA
ncbi:hypothetical protein COL17_26705 [Priestia megaterium]|nr:hypothetical protein COL17_26705 [Priestia megaterium]